MDQSTWSTSNRDKTSRLQECETDGEITGVLGQLLSSGCAFLLQRLESWDDHGEKLHDDRCRDVRHDAECEDGELQERTTREEIDQTEESTSVCDSKAALHRFIAHARSRDDGAETEERHDREREDDLHTQIRRLERLCECLQHVGSYWLSNLVASNLVAIRPS